MAAWAQKPKDNNEKQTSESGSGVPTITITGQRPPALPAKPPIQTVTVTGSRSRGSAEGVYSGIQEPVGMSPPPQAPTMGQPVATGSGGGSSNASADSNRNTENSACETNNPVVIATGEKRQSELDFAAGGLHGLQLERTYRSAGHVGGLLFGPKWSSSVDVPRLARSSTVFTNEEGFIYPLSATITFPGGSQYTYWLYDQSGAPYHYIYRTSGGNEKLGELHLEWGGWALYKDQKIYSFVSNGPAISIQRFTGELLQSFTWDGPEGAERIRRITNLVGQSIHITWSGNRVTAVTDPANNTWNYGYNANGMLASVTSPGPNPDVRTYHYENADPTLLTGISINGVRYSTYVYGPDKRVQESGLAGAEQRDTFSYGANTTTVTNERGLAKTYTTATSVQNPTHRKITSISRAAGHNCAAAAAQTAYDSRGYVDHSVDWNGNVTDYQYDAAGMLLSKTTAAGTPVALTETYVWASAENLLQRTLISSTGAAYARQSFTYHTAGYASGRVASETWTDLRAGGSRVVTYAYTFHPNKSIATITSTRALPGGQTAVTTLSYDALGNLVSAVNPLGHQVSYSNHNGLGLPGRVTDANGISTDFTYDAKGNLVSATQWLPSGPRTTTFAYNHNRQVTDVTHPHGAVDRYRYNAATRLTRIGNALNEFVDLDLFLAAGANPPATERSRSPRHVAALSGSTPFAMAGGEFVATTHLDSLGRPWRQQGNLGQLWTMGYDSNGNLTRSVDAAGRETRHFYDAQNRLIRTEAPDGGVTQFGYDTEGNLATVTDPRGLVTRYFYNGLGELTQQQSPDTGTTTYTRDSAGRIVVEQRAGLSIGYAWDKLDRLTARWSNGQTDSFFYDEGSLGKGRLTRWTDETGSTAYTFNADGTIASQLTAIDAAQYSFTWQYDAAGRRTSMSYPTGLVLTYGYDAAGRLNHIGSSIGGAWATLATSYLYQPATATAHAWRFGNNLPRTLRFDSDWRLDQLDTPGVHGITYGFTPTDLIQSMTYSVGSHLNASFSYDANDRLASVSRFGWPRSAAGAATTSRLRTTAWATGSPMCGAPRR